MLTQFIYYLLGVGTFSTLTFFIIKTAITKSFDFGIERYKAGLNESLETHKRNLTLDIEKYRSELNLISIEHNITFSELQKERATVIKNTYHKLVELSKKLQELTSMFQGPEWHSERARDHEAEKALNDFKDYIAYNRIYLPKATCEKLLELINESWSIIVDMDLTKKEASYTETIYGKQPHAFWRELNIKVNNDLKDIMIAIEDNFRELIGVE